MTETAKGVKYISPQQILDGLRDICVGAEVDDANAILVAAIDEIQKHQWRPIEGRPKDRDFLVYWSDSPAGAACIEVVSAQEYEDCIGFGEPPAKGWQPLPDPPTQEPTK